MKRSDLLVALGLLVVGQAEVALFGVAGSALLAHLFWFAVAVAALYRRSHPFAFALVCVGGVVPLAWLDLVPDWSVIFPVAGPLSVFGVGLYANRTKLAVAGALGFASGTVLIIWLNQQSGEAESSYFAFEWVRLVTVYFGAAGAGLLLRDRSHALATAARRLDALPPARTELEAAVSAARERIAREVQGVVAVCLEQVRSAVFQAVSLLEESPSGARAAAVRARLASRQAMDEMRHMLGLLRAPDEGTPEMPVPSAAAGATAGGRARRLVRLARSQALFLLVLANGILNAYFTHADAEILGGELGLAGRVAGAVVTAALFLPRRSWPLVTVIGVSVALLVRTELLDDRLPLDFPVWAAVFVAATYLRTLPAAGLGGAFVLASALVTTALVEPGTPWQAYVAFGATTVIVWLVGAGVRDRVAQTARIEEMEREERLRRESARQEAVHQEKLAAARELHDGVGHSLTAITLQCAGVERLIPGDIPAARRTLGTIQELGVEAAAELAGLASALSGDREAPLPRLDALPDLAEALARRGSEIRLETDGDLAAVPAGPGAAAYRIVAESLTNATKHSPGPVRARVAFDANRISVTVSNPDPARGEGAGEGFGVGLIGSRERAEAYGGHFSAGPVEHGRWRVQAELPLPPGTTSPPS